MRIGFYFLTLILTLLIELGVAYILGYRSKKELKIFLLANLVTHPLLSYFLWLNSNLFIIPVNYFVIIILEMIVIITESVLLHIGLREKYLEMLKVSLLINVASFCFGLLIF